MTDPKGNSEFCFSETLKKENSLFPDGPVIKCFVIPPNSKTEKKWRNDLQDAYGGCACSTSGSETELSYRNDVRTVFFFAANKNKDCN